MPDGVGDGFLGAAHECVRLLGARPDSRRDFDVNGGDGDALRERLERALEIAAVGFAQLGDDVAHLGEEGPGQALGLVDMSVRLAGFGDVARDLELESERGQLVPPGVVQLARYAQALGVPDVAGDYRLRGPQFPVGPGQGTGGLRRCRRRTAAERVTGRGSSTCPG